jgi:DNA-binding transcriptional ArsR family regulator
MEDILEVIAHPGRRAMLRLVIKGEQTPSDLAAATGMTQPAASQHLKVLRDAGLVTVRVEGQRRLYRVDFAGLRRLRAELDMFWDTSLAALAEAAEKEDKR